MNKRITPMTKPNFDSTLKLLKHLGNQFTPNSLAREVCHVCTPINRPYIVLLHISFFLSCQSPRFFCISLSPPVNGSRALFLISHLASALTQKISCANVMRKYHHGNDRAGAFVIWCVRQAWKSECVAWLLSEGLMGAAWCGQHGWLDGIGKMFTHSFSSFWTAQTVP